MLAEERLRLHPVTVTPFTVAFGVTRRVPDNTPMVAFEYGQYSVPHTLCGQTVWVRVQGRGVDEQVVISAGFGHGIAADGTEFVDREFPTGHYFRGRS